MKNAIRIVSIVILVIGVSTVAHAKKVHAYCEGVTPIEINIQSDIENSAARTQVQQLLQNYVSHVSNDKYELCFSFPNKPLELSAQFLLFNAPAAAVSREIVISGLKLELKEGSATTPLLTIDYRSGETVTLRNIEMSNVVNGIYVDSTRVNILNSTISGKGPASGGSCIELTHSTDSIIKGGDISQCGTGILLNDVTNTLIGAEDGSEASRVLFNNIHHNGLGIHLKSGAGNRWGYNSIYANLSGLNPTEKWKDGIAIDTGANDDIMPVALEEENPKGALTCEYDKDGNVVSRKIAFKPVSQYGKIVFYNADEEEGYQGKTYLSECDIDVDGVCTLNAIGGVQQNQCGLPTLYVTSVFSVDSSSTFSERFLFNGPASVIAISGELPGSAPRAADEPTVSSGDDGSSGGAEVTGGGALGGSAAGAAPKCGATLVPTATFNGTAMICSLAWLALPLILIVNIRRRKREQ